MKHYTFIDYATQGYMALVGVIIVVFHSDGLPTWPWLLLAHLSGLALVHSVILLYARFPENRLLFFLRHYYPILLYTGFYHETGSLNRMLFTGYLDPHFLRLEKWLFGFQPGLELMEMFPSRWAAEILYAAYFSYYLMIGGVGLALLVRNRREFAHYISVVSFVFYVCYAIYIFTPVVGPRIVYRGIVNVPLPQDVLPSSNPDPPATVQGSAFFQIMAWIYRCTVYFSFLYLRPIRWLHLVVALLLCVSTVYGRYHYVVDVVAGALTASVLIPVGNRLYAKFQATNGERRTEESPLIIR
jgi:hypothetical protein